MDPWGLIITLLIIYKGILIFLPDLYNYVHYEVSLFTSILINWFHCA